VRPWHGVVSDATPPLLLVDTTAPYFSTTPKSTVPAAAAEEQQQQQQQQLELSGALEAGPDTSPLSQLNSSLCIPVSTHGIHRRCLKLT